MRAGTARNGRLPQEGAEKRPLRRAAGMVALFNGLLLAWALFEPGGDRVSAIVINGAGFLGPLLVLPLCFGGLLERMWRRGASRMDDQPAAMTGLRLAPILLGMGILSYVLGQMFFAFYDLVLHQVPPYPSIADIGYLMEYPFFLLGILLLPARPIPVASRTRIALDGLMVMTAALTFSWYLVLGPVIQQGSETAVAKAVSVAYPLADIVLISCLLILALRPGERALRVAASARPALGRGIGQHPRLPDPERRLRHGYDPRCRVADSIHAHWIGSLRRAAGLDRGGESGPG
jgi:peptidoglycan/LPS O-acetylase OafA/YrhL